MMFNDSIYDDLTRRVRVHVIERDMTCERPPDLSIHCSRGQTKQRQAPA